MKLRLYDDSIRLRLTRSEVESLLADQAVEAVTHFSPTQSLRYRVELSNAADLTATFTGTLLSVAIPSEKARTWAAGSEEGLYKRPSVGLATALSISIEKDFSCLHSVNPAENTDTFPNPRTAAEAPKR